MNKLYAILRWLLIGIVHLVFYLLGLIIPTLIYWIRPQVRKWKEKGIWLFVFFWYFLNDTTKASEDDIDWGDYGRFKHNYFGYFRQCSIRNSHWNFRRYVMNFDDFVVNNAHVVWSSVYDKDTKEKIPFTMTLCNVKKYWGSQLCFFNGDKIPLFRFSFSVPFRFIGRVWNVQFGEGSKRYLYKWKFSKINK